MISISGSPIEWMLVGICVGILAAWFVAMLIDSIGGRR